MPSAALEPCPPPILGGDCKDGALRGRDGGSRTEARSTSGPGPGTRLDEGARRGSGKRPAPGSRSRGPGCGTGSPGGWTGASTRPLPAARASPAGDRRARPTPAAPGVVA